MVEQEVGGSVEQPAPLEVRGVLHFDVEYYTELYCF